MVGYWRAAESRSHAHRTLWARYEFRTPQSGGASAFRSDVSLEEYDCKGQSKLLSMTLYSGQNLTGAVDAGPVKAEWSFIVPGSLGADLESLACAGTGARKAGGGKPRG